MEFLAENCEKTAADLNPAMAHPMNWTTYAEDLAPRARVGIAPAGPDHRQRKNAWLLHAADALEARARTIFDVNAEDVDARRKPIFPPPTSIVCV